MPVVALRITKPQRCSARAASLIRAHPTARWRQQNENQSRVGSARGAGRTRLRATAQLAGTRTSCRRHLAAHVRARSVAGRAEMVRAMCRRKMLKELTLRTQQDGPPWALS